VNKTKGRANQDIRAALDRHWAASAVGDVEVQHEICVADVVCEYPQSSERIYGRQNLQAFRSHDLIKPASFSVRRVLGSKRFMDHGIRCYDYLQRAYGSRSEYHEIPEDRGVFGNPLYRGAFHFAFWTRSMGPTHWMVSLYLRDLD
jgi:hypothetical protein